MRALPFALLALALTLPACDDSSSGGGGDAAPVDAGGLFTDAEPDMAPDLGPVGEPFAFAPFVYRTLAGAFFATVYQVRGFAVAAWTHAIYDVYVLSLS